MEDINASKSTKHLFWLAVLLFMKAASAARSSPAARDRAAVPSTVATSRTSELARPRVAAPSVSSRPTLAAVITQYFLVVPISRLTPAQHIWLWPVHVYCFLLPKINIKINDCDSKIVLFYKPMQCNGHNVHYSIPPAANGCWDCWVLLATMSITDW